jgi:PAS domain S-box-containing protein
MPSCTDLLDVFFKIKDSVLALDNNCNITYVNQAYADIFGLNTSQMIGKNVWELLPKTVGKTIYKNINEAIEKKELTRFEWEGVYAKRFWETTVFPS